MNWACLADTGGVVGAYPRILIHGFFFWMAYDLARFPVIPLYAQSMGLSPQTIGLAVAASTLTGVVGKSISGGLSDSLGRRILMIVAAFVAATAPLAYYLVDSGAELIGLRFFHGAATAIMGPVGRALVADIVDARTRGRGLSTYTAVTNSGTMAGRWLGGVLLFWGGFLVPFLASFLAGLVALGIALRWPRDRVVGGGLIATLGRTVEGFREVGSNRAVLVTSVVESCQFLVTGALDAFLPIYAMTVTGLSEWEVGTLYALQMAVTILSKPLLGWLSDRVGRRPQIIVGFALGGATVWLVPWQGSFAMLGVLVMLYGLAVSLTTSATAALVTDLCEQRHYGAAHGVFGTIYDAGHAAGPLTAGFLVASIGYRATFGLLSIVLIVASLLFAFLVRNKAHD